MRWPLLIAVAILVASSAADAQVQTRCTSQDGLTIDCETTDAAPALDGYAKALGAAQRLVPNQQGGQLEREQIEQLRLRNALMRRQLERDAAPGYDRKQCRQSAKAAVNADDLVLARDVLIACAGSK